MPGNFPTAHPHFYGLVKAENAGIVGPTMSVSDSLGANSQRFYRVVLTLR